MIAWRSQWDAARVESLTNGSITQTCLNPGFLIGGQPRQIQIGATAGPTDTTAICSQSDRNQERAVSWSRLAMVDEMA